MEKRTPIEPNSAMHWPRYDQGVAAFMESTLGLSEAFSYLDQSRRTPDDEHFGPSGMLSQYAAEAVAAKGYRRVGIDTSFNTTGMATGLFTGVFAFGNKPQVLRISVPCIEDRIDDDGKELPPFMLRPLHSQIVTVQIPKKDLIQNFSKQPDFIRYKVLESFDTEIIDDFQMCERDIVSLWRQEYFDRPANMLGSKFLHIRDKYPNWADDTISIDIRIDMLPAVNTQLVENHHIRFLQDVALMNGYIFYDVGNRNVGLLQDGTPVVIDSGSVISIDQLDHPTKRTKFEKEDYIPEKYIDRAILEYRRCLLDDDKATRGASDKPTAKHSPRARSADQMKCLPEWEEAEKRQATAYQPYLESGFGGLFSGLPYQPEHDINTDGILRIHSLKTHPETILNNLMRPEFFRQYLGHENPNIAYVVKDELKEQAQAIRHSAGPMLDRLNQHFESAQTEQLQYLGLEKGHNETLVSDSQKCMKKGDFDMALRRTLGIDYHLSPVNPEHPENTMQDARNYLAEKIRGSDPEGPDGDKVGLKQWVDRQDENKTIRRSI